MKMALIDAELFSIKAAFATENYTLWDPENHPDTWHYTIDYQEALANFTDQLHTINDLLPEYGLVLCWGKGKSFRYDVWDTYKSDRKKKLRSIPAGYQEFKKKLQEKFPSAALEGIEGDDVMGVLYCQNDVIVSEDKDLLTIPGLHLRGGELVEVTKYAANHAFFTQVLSGDTTDSYPGLKKCGKVGASKILAKCKNENDMWHSVLTAYEKAGFDERFAISQARCARILRQGEYNFKTNTPLMWNPPIN